MKSIIQKSPSLPLCELSAITPLAIYTSLKVGGIAQYFALPKSHDELKSILSWAQLNTLPLRIFGLGSNVLVCDHNLPGVTISTRFMGTKEVAFKDGILSCSAGLSLPKLAHFALSQKIAEFEWMSCIPGTVGGAIAMNSGCAGMDIEHQLKGARVCDTSGNEFYLVSRELEFGHRNSRLLREKLFVLNAEFYANETGDPVAIRNKMRDLLEERRHKFPPERKTCGSVFKSTHLHPAGSLIESCGLKGTRIGGFKVSEVHANFFVNEGNGSFADFVELMNHTRNQVSRIHGVVLQPEVILLR